MSDTALLQASEAAAGAGARPATGKRTRILLVEGDGFTRIVLLLQMRLAGFGVDFTSNGTLGMVKLRNCQPDVLVVELKLCGLSGLELIKAARAEPGFGNRPIYVFTHVDRMSRTARKEVRLLATKVFDKNTVSREALVQAFAAEFLGWHRPGFESRAKAAVKNASTAPTEMVVPGMLREIVTGVRDQFDLMVRDDRPEAKTAGTRELVSRVCSLASCAEAAGLLSLARHAKALENYLASLCAAQQNCDAPALPVVQTAIEAMSRTSEVGAKEKASTRFSAVVVDEAPNSNRALKEALSRAGFESACFTEPQGAREHLEANRTDLIIANVLLPEAHGLALADIRRMPPHSRTPVVFGSESPITASLGSALPARAPSLDVEPVLRAEFVLKALNETQNAGGPMPAASAAALARPPVARQPVSLPGPTALFAGQDGFELFASPARHAEASAPSAPAPIPSAPAEEFPQHLPMSAERRSARGADRERPRVIPAELQSSDSHLFAGGSIISEAFLRAQPGANGEDGEAQPLERMPEAPAPDGVLAEERPVEVFPLSGLPVEAPEPAEPETAAGEQTAAENWLAAAETESPLAAQPAALHSEPMEAAAAPVSGEATQNYEEAMNNPLQSTPLEWALPGEAGQRHQPLEAQEHLGEDLAARVSAAEMALCEAQAELERRDQAIAALEKHIAEAPSAGEQAAQARCAELEQEVATLRQAFEHFDGNFGQEHQAAAHASEHVQALEAQLSQTAAELEKQRAEQQRAEAELRQHQESANAVGQQSEAARQAAEARAAELERELTSLRRTQEELAGKLAEEQKARAESAQRIKELEAQAPPAEDPEHPMPQAVAALARVTAELAKERGSRQRSEQRITELNQRLQALHEDLRRHLEAQREDHQRLSEVEEQARQSRLALEQSNAELEHQQEERRLAEEQLEKAKEVNAQLRKDLSFFEGANKKFGGAQQHLQSRLEANLSAAREHEARRQQEIAEQQRVAQNLENAQRELQNESRKRESLQQELQAAQAALQEREAKLQRETAERVRLKEALDSYQRNLQDGSERDLEVSKLQAALNLEQVERQRQEAQLLRMRRSALESAHAARSLRTSLRRQIREPVDTLAQSAQSLLELETGEEQRKLIEAVLRDVLLVQTRLREPEPAAAAESSTPGAA